MMPLRKGVRTPPPRVGPTAALGAVAERPRTKMRAYEGAGQARGAGAYPSYGRSGLRERPRARPDLRACAALVHGAGETARRASAETGPWTVDWRVRPGRDRTAGYRSTAGTERSVWMSPSFW